MATSEVLPALRRGLSAGLLLCALAKPASLSCAVDARPSRCRFRLGLDMCPNLRNSRIDSIVVRYPLSHNHRRLT
jgi:hypothetical protein